MIKMIRGGTILVLLLAAGMPTGCASESKPVGPEAYRRSGDLLEGYRMKAPGWGGYELPQSRLGSATTDIRYQPHMADGYRSQVWQGDYKAIGEDWGSFQVPSLRTFEGGYEMQRFDQWRKPKPLEGTPFAPKVKR